MKKYQIISDRGIDDLQLVEADIPSVGELDVLVRMKASSINYRDLATILIAAGCSTTTSYFTG
jgi:NADPH:quinone reductase-like Zn-dependent oxidoreductase